jgi:hypothetical protein
MKEIINKTDNEIEKKRMSKLKNVIEEESKKRGNKEKK